MKSNAARNRKRRAGTAALEMALVLPLFVVLTLGLIDFGHMLYTVNTITAAAREGARRGAVQRKSDDVTKEAKIAAESFLDAGNIHGATVQPVLNGTDVEVTVTVPEYRNISGFSYDLPGLSATSLADKRKLTSISAMRWEFFTP